MVGEGASGPGDALARGHAPEQAAALQVGSLFAGRYQVLRQLGEGGMGAVYLAHDTKVQDDVALKTMLLPRHGERPGEVGALDRFAREVRLARKITHANVARTYDMGESDGFTYLTMEYVEGEDLDTRVRKSGRLDPIEATRITIAIADGLAAAHEAGVVHRDLKPGNVMLSAAGRVVLLDFGIARSDANSPASTQSAKTVGAIGTPLYMAPEQISGAQIDARTDLYALGLVAVEMLTGKVPFAEPDLGMLAIALARMTQDPPRASDFPDLPPTLAQTLCACIAREPGDRPTSAATLAAQLRAWLASPEADTVASRVTTGDGSALAGSAASLSGMTPGQSSAAMQRAGGRSSTDTPTLGGGRAPSSGAHTLSRINARALAVLPFRFRGPAEHSYLGEALTEEIIDVLSRTRGLRVMSSSATARFADDRDPKKVAAELEVDAIVDGTIQLAGSVLRVAARLLEGTSGEQLWSDRFEGGIDDVFELQDTMSRRIVEALRLGIASVVHRGDAPPEAVEAYLRGRQRLARFDLMGPNGAYALFSNALALAPDFKPAISGRALAAIRAWFTPASLHGDEDWEDLATRFVADALERAPELAETHLAAAMFYMQGHGVDRAVGHLRSALQIAPTFAFAQQYLGAILLETGPIEDAVRHLKTALKLDPSLVNVHYDLVRYHAFRGDWAAVDQALDTLDAQSATILPAAVQIRMRMANWRGDKALLRKLVDALALARDPLSIFAALYGRSALGEQIDFRHVEAAADITRSSPRMQLLIRQNIVETLSASGRHDEAAELLPGLLEIGLLDLNWLERCPVLAPLRDSPGYVLVRDELRARARLFDSHGSME